MQHFAYVEGSVKKLDSWSIPSTFLFRMRMEIIALVYLLFFFFVIVHSKFVLYF